MSRVSLIEQLYAPKKKSALEFNYDALWAPPIRFFLSQQDINELYKIATSLKYNDNIEKKYELIDAIMRPRGFKRGNCGTNRVVYNFLEDTSFCMKIALDRVGINDSPREYKNQEFFKPFCCKIFEVDPTGVIACVERVNPISSLEEFLSISDDVFNMMITKIIGKYVVDDLGTEKYLNYGIRYNSNGIAFGPVILDYPYAYELDGAKLRCAKPIQIGNKEFACGGEIDYDSGLNNLVCCKCGRTYSARELAKDDSNVLKFYSDDDQCRMRARIIRETDGAIIKDSGRSSKVYMTKEEYEEGTRLFEVKNFEPRKVEKTIKKKYTPIKKLREQYYTELQTKAYEEMQKRNAEPFNPVIEPEFSPRPAKRASNKPVEVNVEDNSGFPTLVLNAEPEFEIPRVRPARRAEDIYSQTPIKFEEKETEGFHVIKEAKIESSESMSDDTFEPSISDIKYGDGENHDTLEEIAELIKNQHVDDSNALECNVDDEQFEYDENGNIVHYKNSNGYEYWREYDSNNNLIHSKDSDGEEYYYEYDEDGREVHSKDSSGFEEWHEYDSNGNCIHYKNSDGDEEWSDLSADTFSEKMEADVFPEISNQAVIAGVNFGPEADYSNYIPPEEDTSDDNIADDENNHETDIYSDLYKTDRKEKKRNNKKQQKVRTKKYNADDMSDY